MVWCSLHPTRKANSRHSWAAEWWHQVHHPGLHPGLLFQSGESHGAVDGEGKGWKGEGAGVWTVRGFAGIRLLQWWQEMGKQERGGLGSSNTCPREKETRTTHSQDMTGFIKVALKFYMHHVLLKCSQSRWAASDAILLQNAGTALPISFFLEEIFYDLMSSQLHSCQCFLFA